MNKLSKVFNKKASEEENVTAEEEKNVAKVEVVSGFFPSVEEVRELTNENKAILSKKYPVATREEILNEINESVVKGREYAVILNHLLDPKDKKELISMGYNVDRTGDYGESIHISWRLKS